MAALAFVRPSGEFMVETRGWFSPVGHAVRYPRCPFGTAVILSEYAAASAGMLQAPCGIGKLRSTPPCSMGPPNCPLGLRVSTTRHGGAATNCSGGEKMAFTTCDWDITSVHGPLPLHAPLQVTNVFPGVGFAFSVTGVPAG